MDNRADRISSRIIAIGATVGWSQAAQIILTTVPRAAALAALEAPIALGMAAAITNIRRALR
jgi:hypothetical protein